MTIDPAKLCDANREIFMDASAFEACCKSAAYDFKLTNTEHTGGLFRHKESGAVFYIKDMGAPEDEPEKNALLEKMATDMGHYLRAKIASCWVVPSAQSAGGFSIASRYQYDHAIWLNEWHNKNFYADSNNFYSAWHERYGTDGVSFHKYINDSLEFCKWLITAPMKENIVLIALVGLRDCHASKHAIVDEQGNNAYQIDAGEFQHSLGLWQEFCPGLTFEQVQRMAREVLRDKPLADILHFGERLLICTDNMLVRQQIDDRLTTIIANYGKLTGVDVWVELYAYYERTAPYLAAAPAPASAHEIYAAISDFSFACGRGP